jgi:PD-(D/E)XK endonuclease
MADQKPHSSNTSKIALSIDVAAEHLVCADLILSGYSAFLTGQGMPYDIALDVNGRLIRIQVKSTLKPKQTPNRPGSGLSYMFHPRRAGKGQKRVIKNDEFEIIAFVALDIRAIAYIVMNDKVQQSVNLRIPECASTHGNKRHGNINTHPISKALKELSL